MASSSHSEVDAKRYDVFVSFRGEDTRATFTSHLHAALVEKEIDAYIDDRLSKGGDIWATLSRAIEDSRLSIVIFSQNYATSKWCLEELVKIMECRKSMRQVVIPVFYKIEPTQIRYQKGSYQEAFEKHELYVGNDEFKKQRVCRWRNALTEAANLSGWDSQSPGNKDDYQLIHNVVNDVYQKLLLRYPNSIKGLVGIDKTRKDIKKLLKKAKVIGIWGMGGIGKTTIAKDVFARLFPQYDSVCFLENVSEESKKHGLAYLRGKLLSELLKVENPIQKVVDTTFTMRKLRNKKVFIVLDDVDDFKQLECLCGERNLLGADSRLIITTRDKHLLNGRVDKIYEVKSLNSEESLKLFSLKAFMKSHPEEGFEQLSEQAIEYAGGVPLALKVLGSHLYSRPRDFWISAFRILNKCPHKEIQDLLRVSYDGLNELEKKIFLDIAFFFKEEDKDRVIRILDACGFEASTGIAILVDKALLTISDSNTIEMHDLLQEMGLEIVRQKCDGDLGRCSRLRDIEDICKVLENNMGTDAVEGITLDLSQMRDLHLSFDTFKKMKELRYLKFYIPKGQSCGYMSLPGSLEHFPANLRYLEWNGYPFKSLPPSFCAKLLVEIRMPHSDIEELWQDKQDLKNLEAIDLSECKKLTKLPDLTNASKLKWMNLSGCESLDDLHPSVLSADTLDTLILDRCKNIKRVICKKRLKSLKKISINDCSSLKEFAVWSDLIENLDLSKTAIETLHTSIGNLHNLKCLNLEGLRLQYLLNELSCLESLKELKLSRSGVVFDKDQLHIVFNGLLCLEILHLKDCSNLFELPDNIDVLSQLRELRLDGSSIKTLPASIKHLQKLETLSLNNCKELVSLPELPPLVEQFCARNCTSLVSASNLNTLANNMIGNRKVFSFEDSLNLDEDSLYSITESVQLAMMSAAFHNVLVRAFDVMVHSFNYNRVVACLPGSALPRSHFTYQSTEPSITINLPAEPSVLGFILLVVLSPSHDEGIKERGSVELLCQCYSENGTQIGYIYSARGHEAITNLNSDTSFVWYNPYFCDSILKTRPRQVSFKFSTSSEDCDGLYVIKECGVRLIGDSEFYSVLGEMELEHEKKVALGVRLGLALEMHLNSNRDESGLLFDLEYGRELDESQKSKLESRRREVAACLAAMGEQRQSPSEFIFPSRPTGIWKQITKGLKDLSFS